ncbi:MAG TPA: hypothetical protein VN541_19330 [Tepidisphaeraceae bacterium]|nr:hypothetical protein [Tepidisphaeraceae bacterium]
MNVRVTALRFPVVAAALSLLLIGMWAGLLRLGWNWPAVPVMAIVYHGPLMVGGFLGTLISLERAVALRRGWAYGAPLASAVGAVSLLAMPDVRWGQYLLLLASALLVIVFVPIIRQQRAAFTIVMGLGAAAWLAGNLVWIIQQVIPPAVPWWMAFPVLTILGERLELSRLLPRTPRRQPTFLAATALYLAGLIVSLWLPGLGMTVAGLGMIALAIWLSVFDLARRTIRLRGLPRFAAACLLSGYLWLAGGGVLSVLYAAILPVFHGATWLSIAPGAGLAYDAILHAVFLGFVFAMIFGHAPIIFPAVLAIRVDYRPRFYAHLALLQLSVLLRIVCDICGWWVGRQWAGLFNAVAIVLFLVNSVTSVGSVPFSRATRAAVRVH